MDRERGRAVPPETDGYLDVVPWTRADRTVQMGRVALPGSGGTGEDKRKGYASRGKLPDAVTVLPYRAARDNNEIRPTLPAEAGAQ